LERVELTWVVRPASGEHGIGEHGAGVEAVKAEVE
jgi:hypothetical protein